MSYATDFAICLGSEEDIKRAALYFDGILPICIPDTPSGYYSRESSVRSYAFPASIVPEAFRYRSSAVTHFTLSRLDNGGVAIECADALLLHLGHLVQMDEGYDVDFTPKQISLLKPRLNRLLTYVALTENTLLLPRDLRDIEAPGAPEALSLVVSRLPMASLQDVSWQQICEFREDPASSAALRSFRRYISRLLKADSPGQAIEEIEAAVEKHKRALTKWGIETKFGTLELFEKQPALLSVVSAFVAISTENPTLELASVAASIGLVTTSIAVHVGRRRQALNELRSESDVLYLSSIHNEFGPSQMR